MTEPTIKPTTAAHIPDLQQVLEGTALFPADLLPDMLAPFLDGSTEAFWLSACLESRAIGFCYTVPEEMTDGTWNMLALAVLPTLQGSGIGRLLVRAAEAHLRAAGQRLLIVDTSGTAEFAQTRRFYAQNGYEEAARIRDFWTAGDDKVTFRKAL